jgi:hypothetical protein
MSENKSLGPAAGGITRRQDYREFAETVRPHIRDALVTGKTSATEVAHYLNGHRVRSHTGKLWSPSSVRYLRQVLGDG